MSDDLIGKHVVDPGWLHTLEWLGWYILVPLVMFSMVFGMLGLIALIVHDLITKKV